MLTGDIVRNDGKGSGGGSSNSGGGSERLSDYEPITSAYSSSDDQLTVLKDALQKAKNCSDSGRGESGEDEESILIMHEHEPTVTTRTTSEEQLKRTSDYFGSKYCTQDCYRLGHSDACWLPAE